MSYGTSDSTVISPITTEAHNLNTTDVSAAPRDDSSPATIHTITPKNRQKLTSPPSLWVGLRLLDQFLAMLPIPALTRQILRLSVKMQTAASVIR